MKIYNIGGKNIEIRSIREWRRVPKKQNTVKFLKLKWSVNSVFFCFNIVHTFFWDFFLFFLDTFSIFFFFFLFFFSLLFFLLLFFLFHNFFTFLFLPFFLVLGFLVLILFLLFSFQASLFLLSSLLHFKWFVICSGCLLCDLSQRGNWEDPSVKKGTEASNYSVTQLQKHQPTTSFPITFCPFSRSYKTLPQPSYLIISSTIALCLLFTLPPFLSLSLSFSAYFSLSYLLSLCFSCSNSLFLASPFHSILISFSLFHFLVLSLISFFSFSL